MKHLAITIMDNIALSCQIDIEAAEWPRLIADVCCTTHKIHADEIDKILVIGISFLHGNPQVLHEYSPHDWLACECESWESCERCFRRK